MLIRTISKILPLPAIDIIKSIKFHNYFSGYTSNDYIPNSFKRLYIIYKYNHHIIDLIKTIMTTIISLVSEGNMK